MIFLLIRTLIWLVADHLVYRYIFNPKKQHPVKTTHHARRRNPAKPIKATKVTRKSAKTSKKKVGR